MISLIQDWKLQRKFTPGYFADSAKFCAGLAEQIDNTPTSVHFERMISEENNSIGRGNHAVIEINNTCNIDCLMCLTSMSTRDKGRMSPELLDLSLQRIQELGISNVELHTIGDPLANSKLEAVFSQLRRYKMRTTITTNGLLLERHIETLLNYRDVCSVLSFSVDGATKTTYEKIRAGGNWDQLVRAIELAKNKLVPNGYRLQFNMVVSQDNLQEVGAHIETFRPFVKAPYAHLGYSLINSLSPDNSYFEKVNLLKMNTHQNVPCHFVTDPQPFILRDGRVSICCRDYDGSMILGDISGQSISEIFQSQSVKKIQEAHQTRDFKDYPLCKTCFVSDPRYGTLLSRLIEYLLYQYPAESAAFYQQKVSDFFEGTKNPDFSIKYQRLWGINSNYN